MQRKRSPHRAAARSLFFLAALTAFGAEAQSPAPVRRIPLNDPAATAARKAELPADSFLRTVRIDSFPIYDLDPADAWATLTSADKRTLTPETYTERYRSRDEDDVPLHQTGSYSPTTLSFGIDDLLTRAELDPDTSRREWYVSQAAELAARLQQLQTREGDRSFVTFPFEHARKGVEFPNPWFSGMGQGLSLGSYARLYRHTGRAEYADTARALFRAMLKHEDVRDSAPTPRPWVTLIDSQGYLWLEEYPTVPPFHTLNGFLFGTFGVYEYYRSVDR
jgi:hypothetical protein